MSELIKEIKDASFGDYNHGFEITTTEQVIKLMIDCHGDCCSVQGYFMSHDDTSDFIGAELLDVKITDTSLNEKKLKEIDDEETSIMFVDLETNKGVLQFVAYNSHNGYYGTTASVESKQLTDERHL